MIKFNIDAATSKRFSGWAFDEELLSCVDITIKMGAQTVKAPSIHRPDVNEAFGLDPVLKVGYELNISDMFDKWATSYEIYHGSNLLFTYEGALNAIGEALHSFNESSSSILAITDSHDIYNGGRHLIFVVEDNTPMNYLLSRLTNHQLRIFFPAKVSGVNVTFLHLNSIATVKDKLIRVIKNSVIVLSSSTYQKIYGISPTLVESGKFITLYGDSLECKLGCHEFQLNNFILRKTTTLKISNNILRNMVKIISFIEYYTDLIFDKNPSMYVFAKNYESVPEKICTYVKETIQTKSHSDLLIIIYESINYIFLNMNSYIALHDLINTNDIVELATRRGCSIEMHEL